ERGDELLTRQGERVGLRERSDRRRSRTLVEQRELAEHVAAALEGHDDLAALLVRHRYLHRPGGDEEDLSRRIVAVEDDLVAGELPRAHLGREGQSIPLAQAIEER